MIQLKDTGNSSASHRVTSSLGILGVSLGVAQGLSYIGPSLPPTSPCLLPLPVPHLWQKDSQELPGGAETLQMPKDLDVLVWDVAQGSSVVILSGSQD